MGRARNRMRVFSASALVVVCAVVARAQTAAPAPLPTSEQAREAISRGVAFLLADQNPDGSWGGPRNAVWTFTGSVWSNPETHRSWKVATTGLCCLALLEAGDGEPALSTANRGIDYLLDHAAVRRPSEWDTMNNWAYIYGVQALAAAYAHPRYPASPRRERCRQVAVELMKWLAANQSLNGGWGYLEFDAPRTQPPQWATSFMTAAAVVALSDARAAGLAVEATMLRRAVRAVRRCRLPSGAYTYGVDVIPSPGRIHRINSVKGSLSRIQSCNLALRLAHAGERGDAEWIPTDDHVRAGLDDFFRYHRFLDMARNRPIPHETYYQNSGYFYLFGHYYAARLIAALPPQDRARYAPLLRHELLKLQAADGSLWDYDMHAYHKPYGTAFGVLALALVKG